MREKKYHIYLTAEEQSRVIQSLIRLKNELLEQGRYTDAVDDVLCKVLSAKKKRYFFHLTTYCLEYKRTAYTEVQAVFLIRILSLQTVKETIGVGVNEKAALSSDKNCPFVYINFDFTLVNKVASL